jgi:hypothetical protein
MATKVDINPARTYYGIVYILIIVKRIGDYFIGILSLKDEQDFLSSIQHVVYLENNSEFLKKQIERSQSGKTDDCESKWFFRNSFYYPNSRQCPYNNCRN